MSKKRVRLNDFDAKYLGLVINKEKRYRLDATLQLKLNELRYNKGVLDACENVGVDPTNTPMLWLKTKTESVRVTNPLFVPKQEKEITETIKDAIESVISKITTLDYNFKIKTLQSNEKALKVTIADDHVGLEPNPNDLGLFKYEYNAKIYASSYEKVFTSIVKEYNTHGIFDIILLDNLGDEQDGWNGFTTRSGHALPQNMTNAEVFETCVDVKVKMVKTLIESEMCKKIVLRKVTNDNHSGDFGHTINIAVKKIINLLYSSNLVEVETLTKFMEHRFYGEHCFILTHGKDTNQMFKGLPLDLNDKTINFVNDYIRFYDIKSKYVHLEKGDLHRIGYNKCSTFDYRNFMSFAPPSSWVQHNFGDCYSGYSIQVIPKYNNEISHTDYFLDYKKCN